MCWFAPLGAALMGSTVGTAGTTLLATQTAIGAMATLTGASTAMSFVGQRQQARAQQQMQNIASEQERQRYFREQTAIRRQEAQQEQAAAEESLAIQLRAQQAVATAQTAAGEAGVTGTAVNELVNSYFQQAGDYRRQLFMERGFQREASQQAGVEAGFRTQMEQTRIDRPISQPSLLEGAVNIAASAYGGAAQGAQFAALREGLV